MALALHNSDSQRNKGQSMSQALVPYNPNTVPTNDRYGYDEDTLDLVPSSQARSGAKRSLPPLKSNKNANQYASQPVFQGAPGENLGGQYAARDDQRDPYGINQPLVFDLQKKVGHKLDVDQLGRPCDNGRYRAQNQANQSMDFANLYTKPPGIQEIPALQQRTKFDNMHTQQNQY